MKIKEIETRQEMYLEIPKGGVGAELGACKGINALHLYQVTKPKKLYLSDIWTKTAPDGTPWPRGGMPDIWYGDNSGLVKSFFEEEIDSGKVEIKKGFSSDFLASLSDNYLDWVYIDSDHNYPCVSIEIDMAIKKVKSGGLILGHDYANVPEGWGSSVIRAVNERIQSRDIMMEAITLETWPSYLCRVR